VTDYHIEVEQKRLRRKVSELKFRITKVKQLPIQESVFPDIENLLPVSVDLMQAGVDRKVEHAAACIQSYMVKERLLEHESVIAAYQKGGMIKAEIDGILAEEFCKDILAPVVAAYEDEKARILGDRKSH